MKNTLHTSSPVQKNIRTQILVPMIDFVKMNERAISVAILIIVFAATRPSVMAEMPTSTETVNVVTKKDFNTSNTIVDSSNKGSLSIDLNATGLGIRWWYSGSKSFEFRYQESMGSGEVIGIQIMGVRYYQQLSGIDSKRQYYVYRGIEMDRIGYIGLSHGTGYAGSIFYGVGMQIKPKRSSIEIDGGIVYSDFRNSSFYGIEESVSEMDMIINISVNLFIK